MIHWTRQALSQAFHASTVPFAGVGLRVSGWRPCHFGTLLTVALTSAPTTCWHVPPSTTPAPPCPGLQQGPRQGTYDTLASLPYPTKIKQDRAQPAIGGSNLARGQISKRSLCFHIGADPPTPIRSNLTWTARLTYR